MKTPLPVRLALLFCPREFRQGYDRTMRHDVVAGGASLAEVLDILRVGALLHVENTLRDLTFALRTLAKSRIYASVVITAIALAIACNASVGSVLEGIVLRPLPYSNANRLVNVAYSNSTAEFSYLDAADFRARQHTLQAFGIRHEDSATLSRITRPITINGSQIDEEYFTVLGAHAEIGRLFTAADLGKKDVVISDDAWRKYFGASPAAIGRTLTLDGDAFRIVGVMPQGFQDISLHGLNDDDYWVPIDPRGMLGTERGYNSSDAWGVLRPRVTVAAANADALRVMRDIVHRYAADHQSWSGGTVSLALDQIVGPVRAMVWLTYAAALVLLIIACANVINLTLVRAAAREREIVMRTALGASRGRIAAQLTIEMAVLSALGGGIGLLLGWAALRWFAALGTQLIPRWQDVHVDAALIAYVCGLLVVVSIAMGVAPALLYRRELAPALKAAGRSGDLSGAKRMRIGMVVVEIALALGLVTTAGLTMRSFVTLTRANLGFDPRNVYVISLPSLATAPVIERVESMLRTMPGIVAAAGSKHVPFESGSSIGLTIPGKSGFWYSNFNAVDPAYFRVMKIALLRGRNFTPRDGPHAQSVAIVNESFAKRFFGTLDAVGRRIEPGTSNANTPSSVRTVVGVVGDTRNHFSEPMKPELYLPVAQLVNNGTIVVRTDGSRFPVGATVKRLFASVAPSLAPPDIYSTDALFHEDEGRWQAAALLFGILAGVALLLALAGIYAITAYSVSQRTQEFGVRKAIGASDGNIVGGVVAGTLKQAAIGIALGLALAAACAELLQPLLFQTSAFDPLTYLAVVGLIAACAVCAALIPAIRATRVPPAKALRYE